MKTSKGKMSGACKSLIAQAHAGTGRAATALLAAFMAVAALGTTSCNSGSTAEAQPVPSPAPATVVDNTRVSDPNTGYALNNDFTRVLFMPGSVPPVVNIGKTGTYNDKLIQARAFMTATILYQPPIPAIDDAHFVGGDDSNSSTNDLVAMRCKPDPSLAQPRVASWPNVFVVATSDLANLMGYNPTDYCPADPADPVDQQVYCASQSFSDLKTTWVPLTLQNAVDTGATIFQFTGTFLADPYAKTGADVLYDLYGIGPAFSGLGYSVENSYLAGKNVPLAAAQALEQSVVTEYLVMNVPLTDANCRCVRVPPYDNRDTSLLNWNRVWAAGKLDPTDGHCIVRASLP
jgi:hypothetical protein